MPFEIIVCGHLCLDLLPGMESIRPENLITTGKLFESGALKMSTGGAVSNTGLALHRLGIHVGLIGLVGDDLLGRVTIAFLRDREARLGDHIQIESNMPSSYTVVLAPLNRDRTFLHCTGPNDSFGFDKVDFEVVAQSEIFHLGYPTLLPRLFEDDGAQLLAIFQKVKTELGLITSLDLTLPDWNNPSGQANWRSILQKTLPYVDIFIPSIEEIMFMLRHEDYEAWGNHILSNLTVDYLEILADELLVMGSAIVGFKLGERGFYVQTTPELSRLNFLSNIKQEPPKWQNQRIWHPAFEVEVVGTTGAGDSAYAGYLAALYRGYDFKDCVRWACAVGACNVEASDATSGILSWQETETRLQSAWAILNPENTGENNG